MNITNRRLQQIVKPLKSLLVWGVVKFYPFFLVLVFALLAMEAVTFPGFIKKFILINSDILVLITLFLGFVFVIINQSGQKQFADAVIKLLFALNRLFLPGLVIIYSLLLAQEQQAFPNYVFSRYHIHLSLFTNLFLLSLGVFLLSHMYFGRKPLFKIIDARYSPRQLHFYLAIFFIVGWIFIQNAVVTAQGIVENFPWMVMHPLASYEQKQERRLTLFPYFDFIVKHSDPDSTIAIPPQMSPWLTEGNGGYVRYFLYPRREINVELDEKIPLDADYVMIARGSWPASDPKLYGWPKQKVVAEVIWEFDWQTHQVREQRNLVFDPDTNKIEWGLIKRKQ